MNDSSATLFDVKQIMTKFVEKRNWTKYHHPKDLAIALSIEANELLELFLFREIKLSDISQNEELMESISEEIADIFAYLLSMTNTLNLDLTSIFMKKMKKNRLKYPLSEFNGNYQKK